MKRSHCERLLDALADGKPHSHRELYGLGVMVHSRVSDLRASGYTISNYSTSEGPIGRRERVYYYVLLGRPLSEEEPKPVEAPSQGDSRTDPTPQPRAGSSSLTGPEQLTLAVA